MWCGSWQGMCGIRCAHQLVAHDRAADDRVRTTNGDLLVGDVDLGDAIRTSDDVAEVTSVALFISRATVLLSRRVEVRTSAHTPVGGVTQLSTQMKPSQFTPRQPYTRYAMSPARNRLPTQTRERAEQRRRGVYEGGATEASPAPGECGSRAFPASAR